MRRYIYFCPGCSFLGSAEHENPNELQECSQCKSIMKYAGITKDEWDTKTKEEKEVIKQNLKSFSTNNDNHQDQILITLENIHKDIASIKTVVMIGALLYVISVIIFMFAF